MLVSCKLDNKQKFWLFYYHNNQAQDLLNIVTLNKKNPFGDFKESAGSVNTASFRFLSIKLRLVI